MSTTLERKSEAANYDRGPENPGVVISGERDNAMIFTEYVFKLTQRFIEIPFRIATPNRVSIKIYYFSNHSPNFNILHKMHSDKKLFLFL